MYNTSMVGVSTGTVCLSSKHRGSSLSIRFPRLFASSILGLSIGDSPIDGYFFGKNAKKSLGTQFLWQTPKTPKRIYDKLSLSRLEGETWNCFAKPTPGFIGKYSKSYKSYDLSYSSHIFTMEWQLATGDLYFTDEDVGPNDHYRSKAMVLY